MINVFEPSVGRHEIAAVEKVLKSHWLGHGKQVVAFEKAFAGYLDVPAESMVATSNCTEALFTMFALLTQPIVDSIFLEPGDEVILPTVSFVGAANAILAAGLKPVFCDVGPQSLNVGVRDIEAVATKRTKAVLVSHYGGQVAPMEAIQELCADRHWWLLEDAASALNASSSWDHPAGTFGAMGCWSFDAMKTLTCGSGGMLYVQNPALAPLARQMLHCGLSSESGLASQNPRWWEFEVAVAGRNAQMNDIAATLGLTQLSRLNHLIRLRRRVDATYRELLAHLDWLTMPPVFSPDETPYFFWVQTPPGSDCEGLRDDLATYLRAHGVYTTFRYHPLHTVKFYVSNDPYLPGAEWAARHTLLLPLHAELHDGDVYEVCKQVKAFGRERHLNA